MQMFLNYPPNRLNIDSFYEHSICGVVIQCRNLLADNLHPYFELHVHLVVKSTAYLPVFMVITLNWFLVLFN